MAKDFDISQFIPGSLCLAENTTPVLKPVHPVNDPLLSFWEEDPLNILRVSSFKEQPKVPEDTVGTPIQEFYRGVNVFITGGTGFLGKVLVEKLLRSMPHIGHVYILIREKKGKNCQERLQTLLENPVFQRLKVEVPDYYKKVIALGGSISEPDLGLRSEHCQLILDSVQVVFHCAADVRFLEPLKVAMQSNVIGSKNVLDLLKRIHNLKALVHVSTAYSQCVHRVVEETVPKMSVNYKEILNYVETNTDSHIEDNLQRILQGWPNTYSFTKAITEDMIQEEAEGLPICIFRPSIVSSTYNEPVRGWSDSLLGVGGLVLAGGLGIFHHYKTDPSQPIDIVPVDYVVNCMIAASWSISKKSEKSSKYVLNFTSSPQILIKMKTLLSMTNVHEMWPFLSNIWYPSCIMTDSYILDEIFHLVVHKIQGIVMDKIAVLTGERPRLCKVYSIIYNVKDALYYFTDGFWDFKNDNRLELWNSMTKEDKEMYNFDIRNINAEEYKAVSGLGIRYFYLKESMDSLPAARRKNKWLHLAHISLKVVFGLVLLKLAVSVARLLPF